MAGINKSRYWVGVLYPENMIENWEDKIAEVLELPFAYCIHNVDKDTKSEHRKDHVHIIIANNNTTTKNHAKNIFDLLSAPNRKAFSDIQAVINIRNKYDYLIHDTDDCRKKGKELYPESARITGNNFDIGAYEQLGTAEKNDMCKELCNVIMRENFINFGDFYMHVISNFEDTNYFEILKTYSGLFERLTRSNFQKWQFEKLKKMGNGDVENEECY